jgi:hypothetical protein
VDGRHYTGEVIEMTIRIPPETVFDRILRLFGKERLVVIPQAAVRLCNELGPHIQVMARRESFFTALFRFRGSLEENEDPSMIPQQTGS